MQTQQPPKSDVEIQNITSIGINTRNATIFGNTRKLAEFTPIISSASICSVTRIVPISEAIFEPTLPARIRHRIEFENSSNTMSRVARPTVYAGIRGDVVFNCIWMAQTAPIKMDMIITNGMESMPSFEISSIVRLKNTLHLSGKVKIFLIKRQYCPIEVSDDVNIIIYNIMCSQKLRQR